MLILVGNWGEFLFSGYIDSQPAKFNSQPNFSIIRCLNNANSRMVSSRFEMNHVSSKSTYSNALRCRLIALKFLLYMYIIHINVTRGSGRVCAMIIVVYLRPFPIDFAVATQLM